MKIGEFQSALIPNEQAEHLFEVFAHPFTAGETVAQSRLGVLRVNGMPARAQVVDTLGNGDYVLRIELDRAATPMLHAVVDEVAA